MVGVRQEVHIQLVLYGSAGISGPATRMGNHSGEQSTRPLTYTRARCPSASTDQSAGSPWAARPPWASHSQDTRVPRFQSASCTATWCVTTLSTWSACDMGAMIAQKLRCGWYVLDLRAHAWEVFRPRHG
jgi:hypothetical protein